MKLIWRLVKIYNLRFSFVYFKSVQKNYRGWMVLVVRNRQATLIYERSAELNDGFHPFLTKIQKNCRYCELLIDCFVAIQFFTLIAGYRVRIKKWKLQTPNFMMRVYSSILMSSLLLSSTAVNAQSVETRSTFFSQDKSVTEFSTAQAENQIFYADSDKETLPERGSGR